MRGLFSSDAVIKRNSAMLVSHLTGLSDLMTSTIPVQIAKTTLCTVMQTMRTNVLEHTLKLNAQLPI